MAFTKKQAVLRFLFGSGGNTKQRSLARLKIAARSEKPNPRVQRLRQAANERGKIIVAPSVAKADFWNLGQDLSTAVTAGAEWLHFSVQDGQMVPKISLGSPVIKSVRSRLPDTVFDVKLGVINPEYRIAEFAEAGADIISIHPESTLQFLPVLHEIKRRGCAPGLVINPGTPIDFVKHSLPYVDVVVVMVVNPGWGGPKYMDQAISKISEIRHMSDESELNLWIEVDGGVSAKNSATLTRAGANVLVAGSSVFTALDKAAVIHELQETPLPE